MSYSIDANLLLYASDTTSMQHVQARDFPVSRADAPDLMGLTWVTVMAYQRIATHPSIFVHPLAPSALALPRTRLITEEPGFADVYVATTEGITTRGNLVPDAHIAALLCQHSVRRIYTADTDFRKFAFLEVVNPQR